MLMFATQNLKDEPTLKSMANENKKDLHGQKAGLAHAPPGDPPMRGVQDMEAMIPPHVQPRVALRQTHEERPGAYVIVPSGSVVGPTRLPFAHEIFSAHHDFDRESQHDVMSTPHDNEININEEQRAANENNPVEAEPVDAVFAEVVVWYKRPLYRWILVVGVVLVVAIVVLGVRLGAEASVPKIATTLAPTLAPTHVPTPAPTLVPTPAQTLVPSQALTLVPTQAQSLVPSQSPTLVPTQAPILVSTLPPIPPPAESIACSFLALSLDSCLETKFAIGSKSNAMIPTELGILTNPTYLYLDNYQLIGTIPSEMGAMTNLDTLYLSSNQLSGTIPSEMGALTNLDTLYLSGNQLTGTIPSEMGALTDLDTLYLYNNFLSGTISTELCQSARKILILIDCADIECSCCFSGNDLSSCN